MEILLAVQDGIPIVREPFSTIAKQLGLKPEEVIERLQRLREQQVIRKFKVFIRKRKVGITANAMVVWKVPRERIQEVGEIFAGFKEVTHCYERRTVPDKWRYNIYTVIHGSKRKAVKEFVKRLSDVTEVEDYLILFSVKEFVRRSSGRVRPEDLKTVRASGRSPSGT